MFSCPFSQNILIYLILRKTYIDYTFQNTVIDCLLKPLLLENDKFLVALELHEICSVHIRNIRKDATYRTLPSQQKQLLTFEDKIKDRLNFLYNAAALEDNLEQFLAKWNKLVTREGNINLTPITNQN